MSDYWQKVEMPFFLLPVFGTPLLDCGLVCLTELTTSCKIVCLLACLIERVGYE